MYYIGYKELDRLLYKFPQIEASVQNLRIELNKLNTDGMDKELQNDILYSLYIGNHELSDMPHGSSSPGDKLLRAILAKDRIIKEFYPRDLADMAIIMADAVYKIEIVLKCLTAQEIQIIELKYFCGKEWREIEPIVFLAPDRLGQIKRYAVEKMANALHMEPEQYEFCMKYVR